MATEEEVNEDLCKAPSSKLCEMPVERNNNEEGCFSFCKRRLVIPSLILMVVGFILLGPAVWAISNKPEDISLGPTLLVTSVGLILMSVALMYSEKRRMQMELTRNAASQQDPLVTDTRAADFLRAGRPDPKEKTEKLLEANRGPRV